MELGIDRKIFNVAQSTLSVGGTATDLLSNVPSLQVDMDGTVSLRGSSSVRILINGRESALPGSDVSQFLQALPANREIGRATCGDRVCQYVWIEVVAE